MTSLGEQAGGIASAAARILLERKQRTDWSDRDLAETLGWSKNTVQRYLHSEWVMPLDAFYRLSQLLDLDPRNVLTEAETRAQAADDEDPATRSP